MVRARDKSAQELLADASSAVPRVGHGHSRLHQTRPVQGERPVGDDVAGVAACHLDETCATFDGLIDRVRRVHGTVSVRPAVAAVEESRDLQPVAWGSRTE